METGKPKDGLTNQLLSRFKGMIAEGVLRPGHRLPPERELARRFEVSRSSLRHALKVLDIMGVLTQRVGDGTYLTTSAARILSEPLAFMVLLDGISLFDLVETRLIVEPELAARAAERANMEDIRRLRESLDMMTRERRPDRLIASDLAFHEAIFRASGNLMCQRLFTWIHQSMLTSVALTSQMVDWKHTLSFHRPIFTAIERRRPAAARSAMLNHLNDARGLIGRVAASPDRAELSGEIAPIRRKSRARS